MAAFTELPKGAKIELTLTADDPVSGLKAGSRVTAIWMGTRWQRPTTVWGRSIPRRRVHEPLDASRCTCGDEFADASEAERHAHGWVPAFSRVRFRYKTERGEPSARPLSGHEMRITPDGLTGRPTVACQCGWVYRTRWMGQPGPVARDHVRSVFRARMDANPQTA
jgi:hypothetical protein